MSKSSWGTLRCSFVTVRLLIDMWGEIPRVSPFGPCFYRSAHCGYIFYPVLSQVSMVVSLIRPCFYKKSQAVCINKQQRVSSIISCQSYTWVQTKMYTIHWYHTFHASTSLRKTSWLARILQEPNRPYFFVVFRATNYFAMIEHTTYTIPTFLGQFASYQ